MAVLNIEKSFLTENRSVLDFLNQSGQGLYIPLYQRDYSWDSDNIEQLLEDLTRGVQRIASGEVSDDSKEIRFLGTIITVIEPNRNNIYPVDVQAIPARIEKLIDGQQRVSTIALMAMLLTKRLTEIKNKVKPDNVIYEQINEICNIWIDQKLTSVFSFDLGRGTPRLKPRTNPNSPIISGILLGPTQTVHNYHVCLKSMETPYSIKMVEGSNHG